MCSEIKLHATGSLKEGAFKEALTIYKKGYEYMKKLNLKFMKKQFDEEQLCDYNSLKGSFLLNMGFCHLKLEEYEKCVEYN